VPLDIGVGIVLALGAAESFGVEATPWLVVFGIACALLPDIDILTIPLLGKWHHRTHTHFPILYVPLSILAFLLVEPLYATIFTLGVFAHLVHDTFGIEWGIAWLWPFTPRKFLVFPSELKPTHGVLATWLPSESPERRETAQHASSWVRHYYFRPNLLAYIEYGVLAIALVILAIYFS
jgi:hypothetical protein